VIDALSRLEAHRLGLRFLHGTGQADLTRVQAAYAERRFEATVLPYISDIRESYEQADLVIARAGASTVAEVSALGIPSLLIPYPHAVAGEQEANARALERAGGAGVMVDDELSAAGLAGRIGGLLDDEEGLRSMAAGARRFGRPDAAARLADLVEAVAAGPPGRPRAERTAR